jgi:uncharacterized protein (UPF0335 family)
MSNVESTTVLIGNHATPAAGHNTASGTPSVPKETTGPTAFAKDQLKAIVERIERLEDEKKTIGADVADIYTEAKSSGYDVKALRTIIRMRKMDPNDRAEQESILDTYMQAMGML